MDVYSPNHHFINRQLSTTHLLHLVSIHPTLYCPELAGCSLPITLPLPFHTLFQKEKKGCFFATKTAHTPYPL
jgi:hypothetical protein